MRCLGFFSCCPDLVLLNIHFLLLLIACCRFVQSFGTSANSLLHRRAVQQRVQGLVEPVNLHANNTDLHFHRKGMPAATLTAWKDIKATIQTFGSNAEQREHLVLAPEGSVAAVAQLMCSDSLELFVPPNLNVRKIYDLANSAPNPAHSQPQLEDKVVKVLLVWHQAVEQLLREARNSGINPDDYAAEELVNVIVTPAALQRRAQVINESIKSSHAVSNMHHASHGIPRAIDAGNSGHRWRGAQQGSGWRPQPDGADARARKQCSCSSSCWCFWCRCRCWCRWQQVRPARLCQQGGRIMHQHHQTEEQMAGNVRGLLPS